MAMVPAPEPDAVGHRCPECPRHFKRLEHLKRHRRSHGASRLYTCPSCPKTFLRSDILRRHKSIHDLEPAYNTFGGRKRACLECARVRERCTKEEPCLRCHTKSLTCLYPTSNPRSNVMPPEPETTSGLSGSSTAEWIIEDRDQMGSRKAAEGLITSTTGVLNTHPGASQEFHIAADRTEDIYPSAEEVPNFALPEDLPANWLNFNYGMDLDYTSILGQSFGVSNPSPAAGSISMVENARDPQQAASWNETLNSLYNGSTADPSAFHSVHATRAHLGSHSSPTTSLPKDRETPAKSESSTTRTDQGDFYQSSMVGARTSCAARFMKSMEPVLLIGTNPLMRLEGSSDGNTPARGSCQFEFPDTSHIFWRKESEPLIMGQKLGTDTHQTMLTNFRRICCDGGGFVTPYTRDAFLRYHDLELFIHLYFKHFDPIMPIIHPAVADINAYWPLAVAVCAIGSQYTETQDYTKCVEPLHEFLQRAILTESRRCLGEAEMLAFDIACVLNSASVFYSTSHRARTSIPDCSVSSSLATIETNGMGSNEPGRDQSLLHDSNWAYELITETRRRICFARMLLSIMSACLLGEEYDHISPQLLESSLPNSTLWSTSNSKEWQNGSRGDHLPSFHAAIEAIFRDKTFDTRLCDFARLILLHGVYSHIESMRRLLSGPLGRWKPSLRENPVTGVNSPSETALLSDEELTTEIQLSNWRNAGLDCIDVLHWAANGTIAAASGLEHPLVMHLHFSRTVITAPLLSIRSLAEFLASQVTGCNIPGISICSREDAVRAEHQILEWAQRDQYKARLSVLHCGCFFWHIRRYSRNAFYEPCAVFLATLTIWAYSSYASRADLGSEKGYDNRSTRIGDTSDLSDIEPSFLRLDRPNDDEMVQMFIREGGPGQVKAYITGVGDIYSTKAPSRILREGMKILDSVSLAWGRNSDNMAILKALAEVTQTSSGQDDRTAR